MNRKELLELYKQQTGGKTTVELKEQDPKTPYQYQPGTGILHDKQAGVIMQSELPGNS